MKKSKKISVLISLVLISILAIGAVSAADDTAVTDDADLAAVDDVQTVDDAPITDEINYESNDIIVTDTGDSSDLDDADTDVISDTGLKGDSDDGDKAVVSDASSPKNALKAVTNPDEPLRAPDGTFADLQTLINDNTGTITLDRNYVWTNGNPTTGITINKNLVIDGAGYTIDAKGSARIFALGAYTVTLKNLNLVNGNAPLSNRDCQGGAIRSNQAGTFTIDNCNFTNNKANASTGYNANRNRGGAIYSSSHNSLTIIGSTFTGNYAYQGGAIYGAATIRNSTFKNNSAVQAGVIFPANGVVNISDSAFEENHATNGGVIYTTNAGINIIFNNCNFTKNYATTSGGVFQTAGVFTIDNCNFNENHAPDGGVTYSTSTSLAITFTNSNFTGNYADTSGGVIYSAGTVNLENSSFIGNHANYGGVVYSTSSATFNILHNVFVNNSAVYPGSVVYEAAGGTINANYNAIVNNTHTQQSNINCSFYFVNSATYDIDYNWWGSNVYNDFCLVDGGYLPLTPKYYILKMRQLSATVIEISLNSLQDGSVIPENGSLPARPYLLTINPADATIRTPTGNLSGVATSNFTVPGNGTITAYVDNQKIVLDIYQNTRGTIDLNVTIANVVLPNKAVAYVEASYDDIYNVTVGDKVYAVTVTNGHGQVELDELPAGTYLAMLSHVDNDEFHDAYNLTTFNVTKAQSAISLTANTTSPTFGQEVKVTPTVTSADGTVTITNGTIIYTVDGKNYGALDAGQDLIVSGLSAGEHRIVAKYGGNEQYEGSTSLELLINVQKATLTLSIVGAEVVYPEPGKITLNSNVDGVYTIYVGETPYEARVSLGSGTIAVPTMNVGNYAVTVNVAESENYTAASATGTYNVTKAIPKFTIDGDDRITYGETNVIHPTLTEGATGTIVYIVDNSATPVEYPNAFTTPILDVGQHTVRAEYAGDSNFAAKNATFTFTVVPAAVDVTVTGATVVYPIHANVTVTASAAGTYTITVNGKEYDVVINEDGGSKLVQLDEIPVGVHYVAVNASATGNYKEVSIDKAATVVVNKPTLNLTVSNDTITYGETAEIVITLKDGDTGLSMQNLIVSIGDTYYPVNINEGQGTLSVSGLNVGKYNVVAVCSYSENYDVAIANGTITVNQATPTLTVTTEEITYGEDAVINISLDGVNNEKLNGVVKVTIDGKDYDVVVSDGKGSLTVSGLAGNVNGYDITAAFAGNDNYKAVTNTDAKQVVKKAQPTVDVVPIEITYGEDAELTITLVGPNGEKLNDVTVTVTVNGDDKLVTIRNGTGTLDIIGFDADSYDVKAFYYGNENYTSDEIIKSNAIIVKKASVNVTVANVTVVYPANGVVTITASAAGTYKVKVGNDEYSATIDTAGGSATVTVPTLAVGSYDVSVTADETANYNAVDTGNIATYTVTKGDLTIVVKPNATAIDYGDSISLDKVITPPTGAELAADAVVTYYVDGTAVSDPTAVTGLTVGTHTVVAKYTNDPNFNDAESDPVTITVNKATPVIAVTAEDVTYPSAAVVNIALTNSAGTALPGATVRVTVNGVDYAIVTNSEGKGKVTIEGLDANEYSINAVSVADDNYESATNGTEKFNVKKADVTVTTASETVTVIYPANGAITITASAPGTYKVHVGDQEYSATIDTAGGSATVTVPTLAVGSYDVSVTADATTNYNAVDTGKIATYIVTNGTIAISAPNVSVTYPEKGTIVITTDVAGTYTVKVGDKTYENVALVAGENEFAVEDVLPVGDYSVKVSATIANYNALEDKEIATYTVNQADVSISISANATEITYGDSVSITAVISPDAITVDDITYYVDGTAVSSATLSDLSAGTHTVVAKFAGDDNYKAAESNAVTITVSKAKADVTVTAESVTYPDVATVVVNSNVPGTYTIRVGNKDYAVVVGDTGSGSTVIGQLAPGTYDIDVSANLGDNYEPVVQIPATTLTVNAQVGPFVVSSTGFGYATLAEALAHTNGSDDTITVIEAGTYKGAQNTGLTIDQSVTIKADEGLEVIFDAEGNNNFLTIQSGKEVTLKDISVINGAADYGAGVYVEDGATLNVVNVNFKGNAATNKGGAIYALGKVDVTDSKFDSNDITFRTDGSIENGGAAIYAGANSELTITGSEFTNNLLNFNSNTDKVFGAVVAGNVATVTDSTFTNNAGRWGGALAAAGYIDQAHQGTLTVTDSTFTGNNAYQGGALFAQQSYLKISDSEFTGNTAVDGGAVLHDTATVTDVPGSEPIYDAEISNTKFDGNIATRYGSAINALSPFKYTGVEFINNQANGGTSTVHYMGTTADSGFALDSIIDGCNFESNTANYYGAVYFYGTKSLTVMNSNFTSNTGNTHTGAILFQGNSLTVDNVIFTSNKGAYTGGIFIGAGTATIKNSVFDSNSGASNYFNIYQPTADTCTLENNVFKTISPTIDVAEDSYEYGEEIAVSGNFNWGVNRYAITLPITEANDLASKDIENFLAGNFAYTIEKLDAGTYTLGIETFKDANGNEYIVSAASDTFVVEKAEATITVDADKYEITYGETVELSSVVSPAGATGAVTYYVDDEPVDSAILTGLTGGEHTVYAKYAGDDNYETAVSEPITITVNKAVPTVTVSSNKDEVEYGEIAELSNVIPADATGAVTYYVDGEAIEGSTLSDLAFGPHTVVAKFAGDNNYEAAESEPITVYGLPKKGTYTDLQYQIDKAISQAQEEGEPWGELSLEYDFEFDREYDLANNPDFINGVVINDSIFIKGNGVEISGEEQARIFNLPTEADVQISSLYLSDGNAGDGYGGAIYSKSEDLQLYDILFSDNYAQKGGAIYVDGDKGFVMGNFLRFKNNEAEEEGGAVYVKANFKVQGEFSSNSAQYGGAIYVAEGAGVDVSFAKFETNEATSGSSIYLSEGSFAPNGISTCNFEMNGDGDGATVVIEADDVEIRYSNFTSNMGMTGSAIIWTGDNGKLTRSNFTENAVMGNGVIVFANGTNFIIDSCNFDNNQASGGIIKLVGNSAQLIGTTVQNNRAQDGAIILDGATISISDSLFKDNNGEALNYNINNGGTIASITGTTFETIKPTITMDDSFVFGEIIPVNGTFDWGVKSPEMTMNFTVNGAPMEATVLDGKFAMNIDTQPDVGSYIVLINTFTDVNGNTYVVDTVTKMFTVTKAIPVVSVTGATVEYGSPATVKVKVTDEDGYAMTGSVIVVANWRVDGETQVVELDENGEGEATFRLDGVNPGTVDVNATFIETDNYASAYNDTEKITITDSTELSLEASAEEADFGEDTIITVVAKDGTGGVVDIAKVNVTIDDGEAQELEVGADGTINLGKLAAGEHNIVVTANDGIHKEATNSTVAKVNPIAAVVVAGAEDYPFNETGKLVINVTDANDVPIAGNVSIEIDGSPYNVVEIDGTVTVDLTGFEVGFHTLNVIFDNPNYRASEFVGGFNVLKVTPVVTVTGDEIEVGETATVKVTVMAGETPVSGVVNVTVNGISYAVAIGEDGKGSLTIADLPYGEYPIAAKFVGNDNYTEAEFTGTAKVVVDSDEITFDLAVDEDVTKITVSNAKDAAGDLVDGYAMGELFKDGQKIADLEFGILEEGTATIAIPDDLDAGEYTAQITVMDEDGNMGVKNITFTVEPKAAVVIAGAEDYPFTETGKLVINVTDANDVPIAGNVSIEIDGSPYNVVEIDGTVTVDLVGFEVGFHTVEVVFDNPNYRASEFVGGFNVTKATPVVSVTGTTVEYGQPATVKFTVSDPDGLPITTGSVIVTVDWLVDGETQVVELVEGSGEATFALAGVAPGTVNITVTYIENDKYASAVNDTENITIKDSTDLSLEATSNEVTYGGDTILNVVATDGKGVQIELSKVNITIDGVTTEYPVDEDGNVNIGKLPAGDTEITVSIDDEVYGHVETKVNATVSPAVPDLTVTPGEGNITIDVKDGETPISGTATVVIDGDSEHPITVQIDETGHAVVPTDAAPGNHAVEVIFTNDNYTEARQTVAVTVPKVTPIVYVNGTEVEYGTPATINITVTDEEGNPINGTVIVVASWEVDGETQVVELVDGKGKATFVLAGLGQGAYADINATYVENDNYTTAYNDTEIIKITPSTELNLDVTANEATFGEDTILTIVAKDGADADVPLTKVNVTVDGGEPQEYDVDENGNVNLGNLSIGDHEITVSVNDGFHEEATADLNATVKPAEANVTVTPGEGNVTVEAKDKNNNPINGTAIIVVDGGEPIEVPIDETGKIEYPIDAEPGAHTVEVTFTNPDYENVTKTVVVNVPKYEATLTIANATEPVYGQNVTIVPTLVPTNATGTITYYVDGSTVGTELAVGENFTVSGLTAGEHNITAKYNGDGNYSVAESNTLTLNVAKAPLTFEIVDAIAYYPDTGTINVAASADDTFTIFVNGVEYSVTVKNGKGSVKVNEKLDVGEYGITWNIPDGDNYIGTEGSAIYQVVPAAPDFSIIGSPEINYGQNNTIIPTITEGATGNITYAIGGHVIGQTAVGENFTVEGLDVGEYTIVATYSGDNNYGTVKANFTFKVLPIDVVVSVSSDEVYYPNTGSINLTASAPGEYTVLVGNKSYTATVSTPGETVTIPVTDLFEVGKYDINVTALATQNYNAVDTGAIGTYVVSKAKSVIEVTYDNATGKITVTLEGEEDHVKLSETISVEVDGVAISGAKTTDGVFVSEDLEFTPGKHSVFAVFVGNENYLGSYAQLNLDIPKFGDAEVTVSAAPIKEGEDAVINITVKDGDKGLTGVVTVTLDGTNYAVDVTDGIGQLTVKNLVATTSPTTTYPITAKFNGNDEYAEATGTGSIKVTDYNDVIIVISGGDDNAQATLIDSDLNPINGQVNVTVDGKAPVELDVVDGKVIIPVDDEGDHDITVEFLGDETHKPASESATVFVGKKLIPTNMVLTVSDITYTENENVVVILTAEDGSEVSGTVSLKIGDLVKEVTITAGQGQTTISGLNAGTKTVIGEFVSDGTYAGVVVSTTFTVKQMKTRIIANNMTTTAINVSDDGRIGKWLTITLVDAKGRALANKKIAFGFNAKVYNKTTDANGKASLQINLQKPGDYTFAISYLGDDNYEGAFEVVKITVNKQKASMTASGATYKASAKTKTLTATLKSVAGNPMPEKKVTFTVNGKTYSAMTDSKGVAKVNVSLTKAGSYSVEVKFAGTSTYEALTRKVTLKLT